MWMYFSVAENTQKIGMEKKKTNTLQASSLKLFNTSKEAVLFQ